MNEYIGLATKNDFYKIRKWLKDEYDRSGEGFWINFNTIKDYFYNNELFVYRIDSFSVGFITGPLNGPSIISVKEEYRGRGVGGKLFKHIYNKAKKKRVAVMKILCQPEASIVFWRKMGFEIFLEANQNYGYMILNYINDLPVGKKVDLSINSYTESVFFNKAEKAIQVFKSNAVLAKDKKIYLKERATIYNNKKTNSKDLVISIKVNNKIIYFDKAKYPRAQYLGVRKSEHESYIYYIDEINYNLSGL
jgi:GNAT superfamily N-acetyltransferase